MKAILIYSLLSSAISNNNTEIKITDSKIDKVTVFLSGAQVYRGGTFLIQPGVSQLVMTGVSPYVDANSLQARGVGDFTIMDVKFEVEYPQPEVVQTDPRKIPNDVLRKIKSLSDSLEANQYNLEELRAKKEVRTLERQMLLNNGTVKGVGKVNDSIPLLKEAMNYFHTKMTEINLDLFQMKKKEDVLVKEQSRLNTRLNELRNWSANNHLVPEPVKGPEYRIVINVNTDKPVKGRVEVAYLVNQAGWTPSYDIRTKDINSPVELNYKANVYQNTGEDWEKIPLTLSSNNPYVSQTKPEMSPWYISYYDYNRPYYKEKAKQYDREMDKKMGETAEDVSGYGSLAPMQQQLNAPAKSAMDYTTQIDNVISAEFEIKLPYTIKSNNEPHLVAVTKESLKANYNLAIVPKLDKNAYLVANITEWEDLNLLPAQANIYYDGTYVGQSYIDPSAMEDTLRLAMGRDNSITAVRKKLKDKEKEKVIGDNKVKETAYEINVRNGHGYTIDIIIEDQIPVSQLADVKVEMLEKGKAELNEFNGFLKWRTKIKPGGSEKLNFSYSVKYDKNKTLSMAW